MVRLIVPVTEADPEYLSKVVPGTTIFSAIVPILPKCRVQVGKSYQVYQSVGYGYGCRTEPTKGSGTRMDVVPRLTKGRVRVWMFHQSYQRVGYGLAVCTRTRT